MHWYGDCTDQDDTLPRVDEEDTHFLSRRHDSLGNNVHGGTLMVQQHTAKRSSRAEWEIGRAGLELTGYAGQLQGVMSHGRLSQPPCHLIRHLRDGHVMRWRHGGGLNLRVQLFSSEDSLEVGVRTRPGPPFFYAAYRGSPQLHSALLTTVSPLRAPGVLHRALGGRHRVPAQNLLSRS